MSGHRVVQSPGTHFYCATKYAVTALTEGLRQELRELKSEIKVTVSSVLKTTKLNVVHDHESKEDWKQNAVLDFMCTRITFKPL